MKEKKEVEVEEGNHFMDKLRSDLAQSKEIKVDKPEVQITQLKLDSLKVLADRDNEQFSECSLSEIPQIAQALVFSENALPQTSARLQQCGMDFKFDIPILKTYITEVFRHRHKAGRKRVKEYIEAMEKLTLQTRTEQQQPQIIRRLV